MNMDAACIFCENVCDNGVGKKLKTLYVLEFLHWDTRSNLRCPSGYTDTSAKEKN